MADTDRRAKDLKAPIPEHILQIQGRPTGTPWIFEIDGVLVPFFHDDDLFLATRMSQRLRAEQGWFEKLIKHSPSVGSFYEDSLRSLLTEVLPSRLKVGTGFVFDPERRKNSKQIDILVYDDSQEAPMYRSGEFVVIQPHMARSMSEVKKTLVLKDVRELVRSTLFSNFGTHLSSFHNSSKFLVFSYSSKLKTNKIFDVIVKEIQNKLKSLELECNDGSIARFPIYSIVLPSFYFLDRSHYIESRLKVKSDGKIYVEIEQIASNKNSNQEDSLNEYVCEMTDGPQVLQDLDRRDFRTDAIRDILRDEVIDTEISFIRRLSMDKILKLFPTDANAIRMFRVNGRRPFAAQIPAQIHPEVFVTFREFSRSKYLSWECAEKDAV